MFGWWDEKELESRRAAWRREWGGLWLSGSVARARVVMAAPQHAAHVWPRAARCGTAVHLRRAPRPQPGARKSHNIEEVNVQLLIASTSIFSQEFKIG